MKAFLLLVCMLVLMDILGGGMLGVLYGRHSRKMDRVDRLLVGWMMVIGLAEAAHLMAVFFGRPFSDAVLLFVVGVAAAALVSLSIRVWMRRRGEKRQEKHGTGGEASGTTLAAMLFLIFTLLVVYQIMTIMSGDALYLTGDMTAETVESFLTTDRIYQVNPLTGWEYESGIPLRIRILCLPTLYAILCRLFGLGTAEVVWKLVPLMVLCLSYGAFWLLAKCFFGEERDREKRMIFMALVAAVFCVGDYLYGMDGFGLLHCGFRGVTIRSTVLVPYVFGLAMRRKWKAAVLGIVAEACIVWTLYGMGVCLLVVLGMAAVRIWQKGRIKGFYEAGEEV